MDYPIRTMQQIRPLLVAFRKHAGLSQAKVAALLGVTQQSYAKIEANPAVTSVERLFTILRLLGGEIVFTQSVEQVEEAALDKTTDLPPAPIVNAKKGGVVAPQKVTPPSKKMERW